MDQHAFFLGQQRMSERRVNDAGIAFFAGQNLDCDVAVEGLQLVHVEPLVGETGDKRRDPQLSCRHRFQPAAGQSIQALGRVRDDHLQSAESNC